MTSVDPRDSLSRSRSRLTWATVAAVAGCLAAAAFELSRALSGNSLSWVYTFEWPLIAAYLIHIRRTLVAEHRESSAGQPGDTPAASPEWIAQPGAHPLEPTVSDPGLDAWRDYVRRLQAADPPGGPPVRRPAG